MLNSDLSLAAPQGGRAPPTDKIRVVSMRRRVPTNWVSGRTLQPSTESVVARFFVPSDFLVDGQVSGLGTVHPLLTLSFYGTWILPLHVVSSTFKRKSLSSVMDGLQRRRKMETATSIIVVVRFVLLIITMSGLRADIILSVRISKSHNTFIYLFPFRPLHYGL